MIPEPKAKPRLGWLFEEEPPADHFQGDATALAWFLVLLLVGVGGAVVWALAHL